MDTWYAITRIIQWINKLGYNFVCPIRSNSRAVQKKRTGYREISKLLTGKVFTISKLVFYRKECSIWQILGNTLPL